MYARVVRWEDGDAQGLRDMAAEIRTRAASGPPEGVPAVGFTMLFDAEGGRAMAISLFASEEDLRTGDEALKAMDLPGDVQMRRVAVEMYEVGVDVRQGAGMPA